MSIQQAINKSLKKNFSKLSSREKTLVKLQEKYDLAQRFLYGHLGFYSTVSRLPNKQVDWDSVSEDKMILFEEADKIIKKYNKVDETEIQNALKLFNQTQFTYSQSF